MPPPDNLFTDTRAPESGETFTPLLSCRNVTIERILSSDRPDLRLYDQPQDEWVLLLQGRARLQVGSEEVSLKAGDHLLLPAHTPHRLLTTSAQPPCLWLAVHIHPKGD